MKNILILSLIFLTFGCIPGNVKEQMNEKVVEMQTMLGDMEFKKAIAQIELHKLRNGHYPNSLSELQFLSVMDSSVMSNVDYTRLDSVYELNLKMKYFGLDGKKGDAIVLSYPPEFWAGLGCRKSNLKRAP